MEFAFPTQTIHGRDGREYTMRALTLADIPALQVFGRVSEKECK